MKINVKGHSIQISSALRDHVLKKCKRLKQRGHITSIMIVFEPGKLEKTAKATVHIAGNDLHTESKSNDLYHAANVLIDNINKQTTKLKEKKQTH